MTAKLFENGRSQAVRLPKECRFEGEEVYIQKIGELVVLSPKESEWTGLLTGLSMFTSDFMVDGRLVEMAQKREEL